MVRWLIQAGKCSEYEPRIFPDSACYLTREGTGDCNLHQAKNHEGIKALLPPSAPSKCGH